MSRYDGRFGRMGARVGAGALAVAGLAVLGAPPAQAAEVTLTPVDVDMTATRATGHNEFLADGVRVWTEGSTSTDKAAGYFDVHQALADVGEPSMDWTNNVPELNFRPGMQLKTDFDADGDIDGVLVGEPILADGGTFLGNEWWLAEGKAEVKGTVGVPFDGSHPSYRQYIGTLDEWRTTFPAAQVLQGGWSLGSGAHGDGVIHSITIGGDDYGFTKDQADAMEMLYENDVDLSQTRATGHNEFLDPSGVRVWTEGATSTDKAAGYFPVDEPFAGTGEPSMTWTANGANTLRPGLQLVVDLEDDGTPDGILVGEPIYADGSPLYKDIAGATNWWLSGGSATPGFKALAPSDDGGNGSQWNGTLAEWRGALPSTATVTHAGWSLGSGVQGDGVIQQIVVGLTTYTPTGANRAPVAEDGTASTRAGQSVTTQLVASDPDGDELTYEVSHGTVDENGELTYEAAPDFVGTVEVTFMVSDGEDSDEGTVTITVRKAPSDLDAEARPDDPTTRSSVRVVGTVTSTGDVEGGEVIVRDGGVKVGTAEVEADGSVKVVLGRLARGRHELKVRFLGSDFAQQSEAVDLVVRVRRP